MDVKNVFLHGDIKGYIYMKTPPGLFSSPTSDVCKFKRCFYGQAPRAWFDKLQSTLLQYLLRLAYMAHLCFFEKHVDVVFFF